MADRDDHAANTAMFHAFAQRRDAEHSVRKGPAALLVIALVIAAAVVGIVIGVLLA